VASAEQPPARSDGGLDRQYEPARLILSPGRRLRSSFTSDELVPDARIARLKAEFGDKVEVVNLTDADAAPGQPMAPHSVLTLHLHRSVPHSGTMLARDKVIAFFQDRTQG
jgi:dienelactone hydrolase